MNNTISTFSDFNKYRTIQILYKEQNHPLANNDYKFNYSNLFNKIESIRGNHHPNIYYQTENNILVNNKKNKDKNQNVINNLKQLSVKKKKIFNNNINILQFNNDICSKTPNPNFTGKKIFLSRYPSGIPLFFLWMYIDRYSPYKPALSPFRHSLHHR